MRAHLLHVIVIVAFVALASGCYGRPSAAPSSAASTTETRAALTPVQLAPALESSFEAWRQAGPSGDTEHRDRLRRLATSIRQQLDERGAADVVFVCTHNSRRSHMAQLLSLAAARRTGLATVRTYSGGTEATAFTPRAVTALGRAGFEIGSGEGANPHLPVRFSPAVDPVEAFSKRYTDPPNPTSGFIVVMTCSQADAACPNVRGAVSRVAVPYDDPKVADGTPEEAARYDERVAQIGRDMVWVLGVVADRL